MCTPVTLWIGPSATPTRLALDATHVYFVDFNGGNVRRIAKSGGSAEVLASAQVAAWIAVDATHAYFTNDQKRPVEVLATFSQATTSVAVDATHVYVSLTATTGAIQKLLKSGGPPTALAATSWPIGLAVNSSHVYFPSFQSNGALSRVPINGGGVEILDANTDNGFAITLDASNVYWTVLGTGANTGEIRKLPVAGGTMEVLAASQKGPRGIAVDGTHVYWTNSDGGTVERIALDGSDNQVPTTLASGGGGPLGIAVDATSVYWADDKAKVLRRVTK
jgi:sugar lactone lactonase YvrE